MKHAAMLAPPTHTVVTAVSVPHEHKYESIVEPVQFKFVDQVVSRITPDRVSFTGQQEVTM